LAAATSALPRRRRLCGAGFFLKAAIVKRGYPETEVVRLAGKAIYVLHDLKTLQIDPIARGIDVVVSGHSHVPKIQPADGVLYLNPGSAGRRRFGLPIALATIDVTPDNLRPENLPAHTARDRAGLLEAGDGRG
jgi:predicted phosphodiesterase